MGIFTGQSISELKKKYALDSLYSDYDYKVIEDTEGTLYFFVWNNDDLVYGAIMLPEEIKPAISDVYNCLTWEKKVGSAKALYEKVTKFLGRWYIVADKNGIYEQHFGISACKAFETESWMGFGDFRKK